jgi:hypothetical protein
MAFDAASSAVGGDWRLARLDPASPASPTRAEPTGTAPVAAAPREIAGQITLAIVGTREPEVEVRLDPPDLGRVQIRLAATEAGLQAMVLAERPETHDFLRRHADALARELTEAGYADVSLDFATGGDAARSDTPPEARGAPAAPNPAAALVPALAAAPAPAASGGLDIRL